MRNEGITKKKFAEVYYFSIAVINIMTSAT